MIVSDSINPASKPRFVKVGDQFINISLVTKTVLVGGTIAELLLHFGAAGPVARLLDKEAQAMVDFLTLEAEDITPLPETGDDFNLTLTETI